MAHLNKMRFYFGKQITKKYRLVSDYYVIRFAF